MAPDLRIGAIVRTLCKYKIMEIPFIIRLCNHRIPRISMGIRFIVFSSFLWGSGIARGEDIHSTRMPEGFVTVGIGTGYFGPTFYGGFTYVAEHDLFAVRYWKADEFRFNVDGSYDEPALRMKEFGLLYGRTIRKNISELSAAVGIAYIDGLDRGRIIQPKQYERIQIATVGFPFEARCRLDFGMLGIGGAWYGNVNSKRSTSGAMLELSLKIFGDCI